MLLTLSIIPAARAQVGWGCPGQWLPGTPLPGVDVGVNALAVLPDGQIVVGGDFFTNAGGVAANRIARFNPTTGTWSALGSGTSSAVSAIAVLPGGDLIVGGDFLAAGGVPSGPIARYNLSTGSWSALGSGLGGPTPEVFAFALLPDGDVIVGGEFTTAGGVIANNIARYNPTTGVWSAVGSGTNNIVRAFAVLPGGDVIVGGTFTTAGGLTAHNIARYNPNTNVWSPLGSGTSSFVNSLTVLPSGDVIVGGSFSTAGGIAANRIARYNPRAGVWSALGTGSGVEGTTVSVLALAVLPSAGKMFLGGDFIRVAGNVSAYFASLSFGNQL
ncbi:MAG: hypothetical protein K2W85_03095 [Phycisphaerales bacterium]|nr:hypothetical protein [Phycisphaerales bacterium]